MHTLKAETPEGTARLHFNSDWSGDAFVTAESPAGEVTPEATVPAWAMRALAPVIVTRVFEQTADDERPVTPAASERVPVFEGLGGTVAGVEIPAGAITAQQVAALVNAKSPTHSTQVLNGMVVLSERQRGTGPAPSEALPSHPALAVPLPEGTDPWVGVEQKTGAPIGVSLIEGYPFAWSWRDRASGARWERTPNGVSFYPDDAHTLAQWGLAMQKRTAAERALRKANARDRWAYMFGHEEARAEADSRVFKAEQALRAEGVEP